jgi:hypothetical protein
MEKGFEILKSGKIGLDGKKICQGCGDCGHPKDDARIWCVENEVNTNGAGEALLPPGVEEINDNKAIDLQYLETKLREAVHAEFSASYPTLISFTADGSIEYQIQQYGDTIVYSSTWKFVDDEYVIDFLHQKEVEKKKMGANELSTNEEPLLPIDTDEKEVPEDENDETFRYKI